MSAEMPLHLPTLLLALWATSSVLAAAVLAVAWRGAGHRGLALWGLGLVFNALSYPTFGLRALGWPGTSVVLTNALTALTLVFHVLALRAFQRDRAPEIPTLWLWGLTGANILAAGVFLGDDHWRNIIASGIQCLLALCLMHQAVAPGLQAPRLTGRWVMTAGAGLLVVTMGVRTVWMAVEADWDGVYRVPEAVQFWTYFAVLAVLLINSMGFVLMQMEHALSKQHNLATHDGLTGVHNRLALMEAMNRDAALSQRTGVPLGVLMVDIDHFKAVNDQHGHLSGDMVLREVAQRAAQRLRRTDLLARYGGEEFVALLPRTDVQGAVAVAEDIRQAVAARPFEVHGQTIPVTVSIGAHVAVPGPGESGVETLLDRSDQALYQAKDQGRNRVVVG